METAYYAPSPAHRLSSAEIDLLIAIDGSSTD
jgi:hypothetical protein